MKKLSILLVLLAFMVFGAVAFAENPQPPAGYELHVNDNGVVVNGFTTYISNTGYQWASYENDTNSLAAGQSVELTLRAHAYIPCYLKMELNGNGGSGVAESFGPIKRGVPGDNTAKAAFDVSGNFLLEFDNEIGGFVDDQWAIMGHGRNAEIAPDDKVFIQGCDTFEVVVYSNDEFTYQVTSSRLTSADYTTPARYLDLIMATADDQITNPYSHEYTFADGTAVGFTRSSNGPCDTIKEYHKFKVPYNKTVANGQYDGSVVFSAVTI